MNKIRRHKTSAQDRDRPLTMSSRVIADLSGKEHKNVLADARKMLDELGLTSAEFSADAYGRMRPAERPLPKPVPYPADVRAKGWRFEIDYEKVEQSDTWSLASEVPMAQPALLMMWMIAWTQVPCGSMPADENLIRLKCRIPQKQWPILKPILMRGWRLAEDGRLYHDTIVERVNEMQEYRRKEAERRNRNRVKPSDVPDLSRGTYAGHPMDDTEMPDTGTGTGTGFTGTHPKVVTPTVNPRAGAGGGDRQSPTEAGAICRAIKAKGVLDANPSNPILLELIGKGVPAETFEAAATICADAKPPKGMAYLLGIVKRQLGEAATLASGAGMPRKAWDTDRSSIEAKGVELGLGEWNEVDLSVDRETFQAYTARVRRGIESSMQLA